MGGADRKTGQTLTVAPGTRRNMQAMTPEALGDIVARIRAAGTQIEPSQVYEVITKLKVRCCVPRRGLRQFTIGS
jgi:hypothetical protein